MVNLKKTFKYVIFDWDGTLAMTMHSLVDAYKHAFVKRGLLITNEQIRNQIFGNWVGGIREFAVPGSQKVFEEIVRDVNTNIKVPDLYDQVYRTLEKLFKADKKMALTTLVDRKIVEPALRHHKIFNFFSYIVTGSEVFDKKPSPMALIEAQKGLNAVYYETVFIGNSVNDVLMGRNAKLTTGIFAPKENEDFFDLKNIEKESPDFIFKEFSLLVKKVG